MANLADIAGVVQGVGSLSAIVVAVVVYARQYHDKRADEEAETVAFVQAIRLEINILWSRHVERVGLTLANPHDGEPYGTLVPIAPNSLVIYDNASAMVGRIDDAALRNAIVTVYAMLRDYLSDLELNNQLLMETDQFRASYNRIDVAEQMERRREGLAVLARAVKNSHFALRREVADLIERIDAWLAIHPAH